jgi:ribosomal protein L30E
MPKPIYHADVKVLLTGSKFPHSIKIVVSGDNDEEIRNSIMTTGRIKINGVKVKNFTIHSYELGKEVNKTNE